MSKGYKVFLAIAALALVPAMASANARLISVTPVSGGCVSGPTGPAVQAWDVESGETYHLTISHVLECGNGGTDATINVRVNSSTHGNTDIVATYVSDGVYEFDFTMPEDAVCTFPIFYCTEFGNNMSGIFVTRNDGGMFQAHLRASTFMAGCTNPIANLGPACMTVPVEESTWGKVKSLYR
jgi:hypothetical protein